MRVQTVKSATLHWREDGDPQGVPIVFANSLGTDLRIWDEVVGLLPDGFRVIRFDKRGHGLSSVPPSPYSIDGLTHDVEELLDQCEVKDCVFVGLSIGGMIGQNLAGRRPDLVKRLVLSNTAVKMGDPTLWNARIAAVKSGGLDAMADAVMQRWFSQDFLQSDVAEVCKNMLIRTPADGYIGCCHAIASADLTHQTATLRLPTLVVAGSEDQASPPDLVEATAGLIPDAQFEVIQGAGHLPCVEAPVAFSKRLNTFLRETDDA